MAYNGGFPATYYNPYIYQQPAPQPAQQPPSGIIWVSGEAGAKAYLVAPNTTVQLWDSESQRIYLKSADASGMPSIKVLDYTIRDQTTQNGSVTGVSAQAGDLSNYVTRTEIDAIKAEYEAIKGQINALRMQLGKLSKREGKSDE